jgi:hypothetical protein
MPHIYSHGNYNSCRMHNNAVGQRKLSATKRYCSSLQHWLCIFACDEQQLNISWTDSCAGQPCTWPVSHIAVATAEKNHPPVLCTHINCLVSVKVQQAPLNVNGRNFFSQKRLQWHASASYTLPRQTPYCKTAHLLLSVARQQNLPIIGGKVQPLLLYHQHLLLT